MNCMRCGTEIESSKVFCESCLAEMDKYPVKSGTRVLLPNRPAPEVVKKQPPKRRPLSTKEKLKKTQKVLKWVTVALVVSLLLLGFAVSMLLDDPDADNHQESIGQNYNTVGEHNRSN